jgi:hypothetical protein
MHKPLEIAKLYRICSTNLHHYQRQLLKCIHSIFQQHQSTTSSPRSMNESATLIRNIRQMERVHEIHDEVIFIRETVFHHTSPTCDSEYI